MAVFEVTKDNFNDVVKEGTLILDFWASWCGPCRMLSPVLEELAESENLNVGKINVDEQEEIASKFDISSIPTLFLVKDGKVVRQTVGYQTIDELREFIK